MVKDLITDTMKKNLIITFITAFLLCLISCGEVLEDVFVRGDSRQRQCL